jgi:hypothetical protein
MEFTNTSIKELMIIHERHFHESISKDDAIAMAHRLVNLYRLLRRPLPNGAGSSNSDLAVGR